MLALAAFILAASSPTSSPALTSTAPWWEKFTFTMTGDGTQQACQYATNLPVAGAPGCGDDESDDAGKSGAGVQAASSPGAGYTKITIERRFTPATPEPVKLETGDTLLGEQVLSLAIDGTGAVRSCTIVGKSGEMRPPYGCEEARTEKFEANARSTPQLRHGFMTVLVYGHEEYPV